MIRASVMYPSGEDKSFNKDYYVNTHVAMVRTLMGSTLVKDEIWEGVSAPGMPPATYEVVYHMFFESPETFGASLAEHGAALMGDMANFTNINPVIEVESAL